MVGAERVHHEERATRRGIGQRFSATACCVPRPLDVEQRDPAFLIYSEAGDGIVAGIGSEQKATVRRENDTARTLEVVRPVDVVDGAQLPRTGAGSRHTFHLGQCAVRRPMIVNDGVPGLVRLHVEMSATGGRLLCSSDFWDRAGDGSPGRHASYRLEKCATILGLRAFCVHLFHLLRQSRLFCVLALASPLACSSRLSWCYSLEFKTWRHKAIGARHSQFALTIDNR